MAKIKGLYKKEIENIFANYTPSSREKLITSYMYLVKLIVQNKYAFYSDQDELIGVGYEALITSIDEYFARPIKSETYYSFYMFIYRKIVNSIYFYILKEDKYKKIIESFNDNILDGVDLEDELVSRESDQLSKQFIKSYLETLQDIDRNIINMYYNLKLSTTEIGKRFCIKKNTILARKNKIINQLRIYLYKNGLISKDELTLEERRIASSSKEENNKENNLVSSIEYDVENISKLFDKSDINILLSLLQSNTYRGFLGDLSCREIVIISLKFGLVNGKYYSSEEIATFLNIPFEEVVNTAKKVLVNYQQIIASKKSKIFIIK